MKKDRNCGGNTATPYPVYPTYPGMMPNNGMIPNAGMMPNMMPGIPPMGNGMMQPMPAGVAMPTPIPTMGTDITIQDYDINPGVSSDITNQINTMRQQISSLERRVSSLEGNNSSLYNSSNYNSSNFHMM